MTHDHDVLIAGGGLVGGSLALALRGSGLRVAVIEAQPESARLASAAGDRALALSWGSAQILRQLGIWGDIEPHAAAIRHIHVSDRGHLGKVRMHADDLGVAALGYVATARVIETAIARALSAAALDMLCPASLMGVTSGRDGVHVSLRHGAESMALTARLLIGADGGNSTVRRLLEIGQTVREYGQTAIVTEVETALPNQGVAYERFTAAGPLAMLPLGKRRSSVVWTQKHADAEELVVLSDAEFRERLQQAFGFWLGKLTLTGPRHSFPLRLIRAERMQAERVLLVGNAMHQLHPVAGQGFNLGLRDVALLAERLTACREFGEDIGEPGFLQRYVKARHSDLEAVIRFTDGLVGVFSTDLAPVAFVRNLGLLALDQLPPLKNLLTRHAMGLSERLPRFS